MPPDSSDKALLIDMLEAALALSRFIVDRTEDDYFLDDFLRSAVERKLEIISEASHKISDDLKKKHSEIDWDAIYGQRNVIAHIYGKIDDARIWKVCVDHIPELVQQIKHIIN